MTKVVLATGNQGKVAEMRETLQEFGFNIYPQSDFDIPEAVEDGLTFVENAIIKARHACRLAKLPAIADDSGLQVDALLGAPGIYSARYAGSDGDQANNTKLLSELEGVENRAARFVCVIVYMQTPKDPRPLICQGVWEGQIALREVGQNGFGYDPLFFVPEQNCHSAELDPMVKKNISHRAKALAELHKYLNPDYSLETYYGRK